MNTLDTRELITVSTATVWSLISNLTNNTVWQTDCRSVSFLTTHHVGEGVRWRSTTVSGRDMVYEITVWYEGIGYEYTIIDGSPFRESKGRLRLQDVPEGTVVQWTFSYEPIGILGSIKDSLSVRHKLEAQMVDSLKRLRKGIDRTMPKQEILEAKSLMRDAPDAEARKNYKPRHPSALSESPISDRTSAEVIQPTQPAGPAVTEPPVTDEDTRPRVAAAVTLSVGASNPINEPDFLPSEGDRFKPPAGHVASMPLVEAVQALPLLDNPATDVEDDVTLENAPHLSSVSAKEIKPPTPIIDLAEASEDTSIESIPTVAHIPAPSTILSGFDPIPLEHLGKKDTSEVSIWEIFGVPRPSASQQMQKVILEQEEPSIGGSTIQDSSAAQVERLEITEVMLTSSLIETPVISEVIIPPQPTRLPEESRLMTAIFNIQPAPYPYRVGLRAFNRHTRAAVRHPKKFV